MTILDLPYEEYLSLCMQWKEETQTDLSNIKKEECPIHLYGAYHNKCCKAVNPGIKNCELCEKPICSACLNHNVQQLSRVTGYMSSVEGWNSAKLHELKNRKRYDIK